MGNITSEYFSTQGDNELDNTNQPENHAKARDIFSGVNDTQIVKIKFGNNSEIKKIQDFQDDYHSNLSVREIKAILKRINGNLKLPTAPWLDTDNELLIQNYFIQLELEDERKTISLEEIFTTEIRQGQLKRIYIEAPPGFGKTTLAYKLITDWVMDDKYIEQFSLAFLVILRYLKGKSVKTMLSEIIKHKEKENLWELINNKNTLLIFDGLDEIGDEDRLKIINLQFKGTIIITGRTGSYRLDPNKKLKYLSGRENSNKFWDRRITICGIKKENRFFFLRRLFDEFSVRVTIKYQIIKLTKSLDEMFKSPLMLILLAYVLIENPDLNIRNKTDLYKNLINCLVIRSKMKIDSNFNQNFNLFGDMETSSGELTETFDKFGSMALINFKQNNLQFESDDNIEKIYRLGFLIKHENNTNKLNIKVHYEGLHLSIIEFAIAFSFWLNYKRNGYFTDDQLICIKNFIVEKGKESLIVPFLCGLMGEKVNKLFNELKPLFNLLTCVDISFLLSECYKNESLFEAINCFIPHLLEIKYNKPSNELVQLIKYGVQFKKLKHITIDIEFLAHLPVNLTGVNIHVIISSNIQQKAIVELNCKTVTFDISDNLSDLELKFVVNTFNSIDSESKQIEINNLDVVKLFLKNECKITRLDELKLKFRGKIKTEDNITAEEFIAFVTENCRVKTIVFNINSDYFKLLQELLIFSNLFEHICCHDIDKIQFHIYCNTDKIIFLPKFDNTKLELEWEKYKPFERLFNIKRKMN